MALMTLSEYARYKGISQPYISAMIKREKIPVAKRIKRGKRVFPYVDSVVVDQILQEETDHSQQRVATRGDRQAVRQEPEIEDDVETPVGGVSKNTTGAGGQVYSKARGLRETYAAMTARLDYEQKSNKVIAIATVNNKFSRLSSQIQQNLMGLSSRICSMISAEYQTAVDLILKKMQTGVPVTTENLVEVMTAVMNMKKAHDLIEGEVRKSLQGIADGKAV